MGGGAGVIIGASFRSALGLLIGPAGFGILDLDPESANCIRRRQGGDAIK